MGAYTDITKPLSCSYAGYAWEFLRRNPGYRAAFERSRSAKIDPRKSANGGCLFKTKNRCIAAEKWGLQYFADPGLDYLSAPVFWTKEAFPGALPVEIEPTNSKNLTEKCIQFSDILCVRQHLITANGERQSVLKSPYFWLQFFGSPDKPTHEKGRVIIRVDGSAGMRKRINILQFLADLRDGKEPLTASSQGLQTFENLRFYGGILDLKARGHSYREISTVLLGQERTQAEWETGGCSLKSKIVRGLARGQALSRSGYRDLLKK